MLPNKLLAKLQGVKEVSAVTTLSLQLKEPSVVLVPPGLTYPISPAESGDGDFYAISRISQATSIRLHYCKQDFPKSDQLRLRTFACALTNNALKPPCINYTHFNGGLGAQERNWTVFDQLPPLPTYNQVVLPEAALRKRSRGEVCSSFEVDMPTEVDDPDGASSHPVIKTPPKVRQSTQDVAHFGSDVYDTQTTSTMCSPAMSAKSRHSWEMSPSNIVPTVFRRGRCEPEPIAEPPRYQKKRPKLDLSLKDMPSKDGNAPVDGNTVREIIQDVVDKEKQAILDEHQEMCDEAEIRVAEAIDDGRLTIIGKTDECCDEIDEHGQKVQEAYSGFANVFIAVNHELRKELVAAWTKRRTGI
ncbi:hypothetical protein KCV03_g10085, partial [Aureobasidium melanogenum]